MTGFYPTILKCPELSPDIYLTEQVGSTLMKSTGGIAVIGFDPNCPDRTAGCRLVRGWNDSTIYGQTGYSEAAVMVPPADYIMI